MYLNKPKYQQQQGFVLILVVVLLAALTLIGVSSMDSASMELRATANARHHHVAFNGVQSILEFALSDVGANLIDYQTNDPGLTQIIDESNHTVTNTSNLSASVVFEGCTVGVGSSLEEGKGFSYNFYGVTGTGSNSSGSATSIQNQGVRFPAAAC